MYADQDMHFGPRFGLQIFVHASFFLPNYIDQCKNIVYWFHIATSSQNYPGSSSSSLLYPWCIAVDWTHQMEMIEGLDRTIASDFSSKRLWANEVIFTIEVDRLLVLDVDQRLLEDFSYSWRPCRPEVTKSTKNAKAALTSKPTEILDREIEKFGLTSSGWSSATHSQDCFGLQGPTWMLQIQYIQWR